MNLQQNLWKAWIIQKKILTVRNIRQELRTAIAENQQICSSLTSREEKLSQEISSSRSREAQLDQQVIRYQADIARTKDQANQGLLDFETSQAQCEAIEAKIEGYEEEYFVLVEEREAKEKEVFLCQQKYKLRERNLTESIAKELEQVPLLDREEESHEEDLQKYLAHIPPNHQRHFETYRFSHPNLVARLRESFCGSCSTRMALGLVGEIVRTANVHICPSCKAFCIAPS